jgi:hypothetical protein
MPAKVAAAQQMESGIVMHKTKDATKVKLLRSLRLIFSTVAKIKFGPKEKRPSEQIFPTTRQPDVWASTSADPLVVRPAQQSDLQPSSDQGGRTCCSGQGHVLLHIASTKAEPACCVARGPFFMTVGRKNGFCPPSWAFIPASCRLFGGAGLWCREALSLAYQNYLPSIHQLYLPVGGGTSSHE